MDEKGDGRKPVVGNPVSERFRTASGHSLVALLPSMLAVPARHDMPEDYDPILEAARGVARNRGVPAKVLDLEIIVAALHAATGADIEFCRKRLVESIKTESFLPLIPKINSVEDPMRPTAALLARALFARALDTKLDITTFAKAVIAAAYAEMAGTSAATVREDVELVVDHLLFEIRMEAESQSRRGTSSKP